MTTPLQKQNDTDLWTDEAHLEGRELRLEPLGLQHLESLARTLTTPFTWHGSFWGLKTKEDIQTLIERSQLAREQKINNAFAMVLKTSGLAVGVSNYMQINRKHQSLEIGGTWIAREWQKTFVNTEAKLLMLGYAFETIGCQRVEFRVDAMNFNSQRAVTRLGAKLEGELRQSHLRPDGQKRDYKIFSVIDGEWPKVKSQLNWYLDRYVHS